MNLDRALQYNRERPYGVEHWVQIQRIVGVAMDGVPGPDTARAAARWQARRGLDTDGKVGRRTLRAMGIDAHDIFSIEAIRPRFPGFIWGIDVSVHQDDIDWSAVTASFAFIKATEGRTVDDERFEEN